jgi:glycosyltransferase involved in cell wall biosynthesis
VRVAYVTTYDPRDVNVWSGLGSFIWRALENAGVTVEPIGPLETGCPPSLLAKRGIHRYLKHKQYLWQRSPGVARRYAEQIRGRLSRSSYDVVFSLDTVPIALLDDPTPIVTWTDATFASMLDFYPGFSTAAVAQESIDEGLELEEAAIQRSRLSIYASDWAAASAVGDLGADPRQVEVVPFGANIARAPREDEVAKAVSARPANLCRLLFVGKVWERKGGPTALALTAALNDAGLQTELTVVGCNPTIPDRLQQYVKVLGFLEKTGEGSKYLESLLSRAHFLVLPARAECYGLALCEANAYAVPCITTNVGGVPTIVRNGVNGMMFAPDTPVEALAGYVQGVFRDVAVYTDLAMNAYREYNDRLNWTIAGERVAKLLQRL